MKILRNLLEEDAMSIPVITLTPYQAEDIAGLREDLRKIKEAIEALTREQREKQEKLDGLLHKVALSNALYRQWTENKKIEKRQPCQYVPTISEDGHAVVILRGRGD